jgi:hypothetical protein
MFWKIEVAMDDSGEWVRDPLRFATKQGALIYARDLEFRCSAVRATRIVESADLPLPALTVGPRGSRDGSSRHGRSKC